MPDKLTVLMPVFNGERFLKEAIESILEQTYEDFIFLIVDDASDDNTPSILDHYASRDTRIKLVTNQTNLGVTGALNRGLEEATTTYLARMDSDDISEVERLAKQVAFLDEHKDYVLVGCNATYIDENNRELPSPRLLCKNEHIKLCLPYTNQFAHGSVIYRRAWVPSYDPAYPVAEDFELWNRLALKGKLSNLPERLYKVRSHDKRISIRRNEDQRASDLAISRKYLPLVFRNTFDGREFQTIQQLNILPDDLESGQEMLTPYFRYRESPTPENRCRLADAYFNVSWIFRQRKKRNTARKFLLEAIKLAPLRVKNYKALVALLLPR